MSTRRRKNTGPREAIEMFAVRLCFTKISGSGYETKHTEKSGGEEERGEARVGWSEEGEMGGDAQEASDAIRRRGGGE